MARVDEALHCRPHYSESTRSPSYIINVGTRTRSRTAGLVCLSVCAWAIYVCSEHEWPRRSFFKCSTLRFFTPGKGVSVCVSLPLFFSSPFFFFFFFFFSLVSVCLSVCLTDSLDFMSIEQQKSIRVMSPIRHPAVHGMALP